MNELFTYDYESGELCHSGRLGMKWGQHIFGDDKRFGIFGRDKNNKPKNDVTPESFERSVGIKASSAAEATSIKDQIIRSGDPRLVAQYSSMLSNKELTDAIDRISINKRLDEAIRDTNPNNKTRVESLTKKAATAAGLATEVGKIMAVATTGVKLYQAIKGKDDKDKGNGGQNKQQLNNKKGNMQTKAAKVAQQVVREATNKGGKSIAKAVTDVAKETALNAINEKAAERTYDYNYSRGPSVSSATFGKPSSYGASSYNYKRPTIKNASFVDPNVKLLENLEELKRYNERNKGW